MGTMFHRPSTSPHKRQPWKVFVSNIYFKSSTEFRQLYLIVNSKLQARLHVSNSPAWSRGSELRGAGFGRPGLYSPPRARDKCKYFPSVSHYESPLASKGKITETFSPRFWDGSLPSKGHGENGSTLGSQWTYVQSLGTRNEVAIRNSQVWSNNECGLLKVSQAALSLTASFLQEPCTKPKAKWIPAKDWYKVLV